MFKNGQEEVEDDPRSGRPSTSKSDKNVSHVRDLLNTDRRTRKEIAATWQLHHDNTLSHTALRVREFLATQLGNVAPALLQS